DDRDRDEQRAICRALSCCRACEPCRRLCQDIRAIIFALIQERPARESCSPKSMAQPVTGNLDGRDLRIGIVVSRWNRAVTDGLLSGAQKALETCAVTEDRVTIVEVPGAVEIPVAAQALAVSGCDAVVAL